MALRRWPLYPSELRPHTDVLIVASQTFRADIAPIAHSLKTNLAGRTVGLADRFTQIRAIRGDSEHTPARGYQQDGNSVWHV